MNLSRSTAYVHKLMWMVVSLCFCSAEAGRDEKLWDDALQKHENVV